MGVPGDEPSRPSASSNMSSCAPGCGRSRRTINLTARSHGSCMSCGQRCHLARSSSQVEIRPRPCERFFPRGRRIERLLLRR